MRESERKASDSVAKKRYETPELIALRAAMLDGTDSSKLARAIRNAELQLDAVSAAVIRRARTVLSERRRLEKLAEVQRKKAAARNRSIQEAAARIAVRKQQEEEEEELAKEEAKKANQYGRLQSGSRTLVSSVIGDEHDILSTSSREDVSAQAKKEEQELNLAIQESLAASRTREGDAASTTLDADTSVRGHTSSRDVSSEHGQESKRAKTLTTLQGSERDSSGREVRKQQGGVVSLGAANSAANRNGVVVPANQQHDNAKASGQSIPTKHAQSQSFSSAAATAAVMGAATGRGGRPHVQASPQRHYQTRQQQQQQRLPLESSTKVGMHPSLPTHDVPYLSASDETSDRGSSRMHGTAASFYRTEAHAMKQHQQTWKMGAPPSQNSPSFSQSLRQQQLPRKSPVAYSAAPLPTRHTKDDVASSSVDPTISLPPPEKHFGTLTRDREVLHGSYGEEEASPALVSHMVLEPDVLHRHTAPSFIGHHPLHVPSAEYHNLRTDSSSSATTQGSVDATKLSSQNSLDMYDVDSGVSVTATPSTNTGGPGGSSDRMFEGILNYVLPDDILDDLPIAARSQRTHHDAQGMMKPGPSRDGNRTASSSSSSSEFFSWNNHFNSIFGGRGLRSMWGSSGVHEARAGGDGAAAAPADTMTNADTMLPADLASTMLWNRSDSGSSTASSNVQTMAPDMTHPFLYASSYDHQQQQQENGWVNTSSSSVSAQLDRIGMTRYDSGHERYSNIDIGADMVDDDTMKRFSRSTSL